MNVLNASELEEGRALGRRDKKVKMVNFMLYIFNTHTHTNETENTTKPRLREP